MISLDTDTLAGARILIVDDDPGIRSLIGDFLTKYGFLVDTAQDGMAMDAALARARVDLILLDLMMPGEDGLTLCRRLAANDGPPVIMLSAMGDDTDRIVGLEIGADDYLAKPCNPRELLARVRAVLRRPRLRAQVPIAAIGAGFAGWRFAGWFFEPSRRELRDPVGQLVYLSDGEFSLLRAFVEHPQRALTRDQLLEYARGPHSDAFDRAIDVQVSRLRRKLGGSGAAELIRTLRNEGYIFQAAVTR